MLDIPLDDAIYEHGLYFFFLTSMQFPFQYSQLFLIYWLICCSLVNIFPVCMHICSTLLPLLCDLSHYSVFQPECLAVCLCSRDFLYHMVEEVHQIFDSIKAWCSHSLQRDAIMFQCSFCRKCSLMCHCNQFYVIFHWYIVCCV